MSSNRLTYDTCAYQSKIKQSSRELDYMMYTGKYNNNKVFPDQVALYSGNLVDLESDLRGQTKMANKDTECYSKKMFKPIDLIVENFQTSTDTSFQWKTILILLGQNPKLATNISKLKIDQQASIIGKSGLDYLNNKSDSLADSSFKTLLADIALSLSRNSNRIRRIDTTYSSLKESINEYIENNPINLSESFQNCSH